MTTKKITTATKRLVNEYCKTGRVATIFPIKRMISLGGGRLLSIQEATQKMKDCLASVTENAEIAKTIDSADEVRLCFSNEQYLQIHKWQAQQLMSKCLVSAHETKREKAPLNNNTITVLYIHTTKS